MDDRFRTTQGMTWQGQLSGSTRPGLAILPSSASNSEADGESLAVPRVLIIDDEPTLRRAIQRCFPNLRVVFAEDGRQALEIVQAMDFEVVICDLSLPDMCGSELHDLLVGQRPSLLGRILMITGGPCTDEAQRFLARPDVIVLRKPFGPAQVREAVAERLRQPLAS